MSSAPVRFHPLQSSELLAISERLSHSPLIVWSAAEDVVGHLVSVRLSLVATASGMAITPVSMTINAGAGDLIEIELQGRKLSRMADHLPRPNPRPVMLATHEAEFLPMGQVQAVADRLKAGELRDGKLSEALFLIDLARKVQADILQPSGEAKISGHEWWPMRLVRTSGDQSEIHWSLVDSSDFSVRRQVITSVEAQAPPDKTEPTVLSEQSRVSLLKFLGRDRPRS